MNLSQSVIFGVNAKKTGGIRKKTGKLLMYTDKA